MALRVSGPESRGLIKRCVVFAKGLPQKSLGETTLGPNHPVSILNSAKLLQGNGFKKDAIAKYFRYLEIQPNDIEALRRVGGLVLGGPRTGKDLEKLIACLDRAVTSLSDNIELKELLAKAHMQNGSLEAARRLFEMVYSVGEQKGDEHSQAKMLVSIAEVLREQGHTGKALELLKQAQEHDPMNFSSRLLEAQIIGLPEFGRLDEAIALFDSLISLAKSSDELSEKLRSKKAMLLAKNGRHKDAIGLFLQCPTTLKISQLQNSNLADCYTHLGKNFIAARYYWKALVLSGNMKDRIDNFSSWAAALVTWIRGN